MSEFFTHYPQVNYDITGNRPVRTNVAINLMVREKVRIQIAEDVVSYNPYYIPEGERPDITAYNKYGDVKYTWLIFLINDMHHPLFDWPLSNEDFRQYMTRKYGSVDASKSDIHHYKYITRARVEATETTEPLTEEAIEVDLTTYNSLDSGSREIVYSYDWEVDKNEAKRQIKLISKTFASTIMKEHSETFGV